MIANPTLTSAAATTIIKKTNNWASVPAATALVWAPPKAGFIFENATNNKFTAFNISSIHMKIMIAFLRVKTPVTPIQNKHAANAI